MATTKEEVETILHADGVPADVERIDDSGTIHLTNGLSFASLTEVIDYTNDFDPTTNYER